MYTIGEISNKFAISRSTLLYYVSIGLFSPSGRSHANYRLYSDEDIVKMEKITIYRDAELSLKSIIELLKQQKTESHSILEHQLLIINKKTQALRNQQSIIIKILESENTYFCSKLITKKHWIALLKATGLNQSDMEKWHIEFEKMSPEAHQDFLESLGTDAQEITLIRQSSSDKMKNDKLVNTDIRLNDQ